MYLTKSIQFHELIGLLRFEGYETKRREENPESHKTASCTDVKGNLFSIPQRKSCPIVKDLSVFDHHSSRSKVFQK